MNSGYSAPNIGAREIVCACSRHRALIVMQEPLVTNDRTFCGGYLLRWVSLVVLLSARIALGDFTDVTATVMPDLASTNQLAWGDYDNDGFVDVSFYGTLLRNYSVVNFSTATLEP